MLNNHGRISETIAENVRINLGGGVEAIINIHLNEEGFLLFENLGLESFDHGFDFHKRGEGDYLVELQILYLDEDYDE